jgi:branched-subunit amino acid ABC-type transport system permease component
MTSFFQNLGMGIDAAWFTATIAGILLIALPLMLAVAMIIYAERKLWAAFALRRGPNVVGPFGVLQSFADGLKVFLQETIIPSASNRGLFLIAPIITFTVALMAWAVIPFADGVVLSNINVGLLYILAISSLGVYGVVIAGWASNSKYPFYSAMRAAAQNPDSASLVGIPVSWMLALGWGLASAIGAVAGMMMAPVVFLDPNMMGGILLYGFAAALLGGIDNPWGAVIGGFIVGVLENILGAYVIGTELKLSVALVLIVGTLTLMPNGLFGRKVVTRV